ncbi:MAG: VanW family protein [Clostridia bacterium]|nr:VanW family protein [Clostridia bacterium]
MKISKKLLLPVALIASGIFIKAGEINAFAFPLPSEEILSGYELTVSAMGKNYTFSYPEIDISGGRAYLKNCREVVEGIYYDTVKKPVDAEVKIYPEREDPFVFSNEKDGVGIDRERLIRDIDAALYKRAAKLKAKEVVLKPTETVENLKKSTYRLTSFSTSYHSSTEERKRNIALAAKYIGGVRLNGGEEFSFNGVVGERSEKRGFSGAKIILNGKFIEGIGGGVCQVSSTLYNAAVLAGLTVTERHSHSLAVGYVEPSFDAMVNSGSSDLKFVNTGEKPVYIVVNATGEKITARIYGEKSDYTYRRVSVVEEYIEAPESEIVETDEMPTGESRVSVYPKRGLKSTGYIDVYKNGKFLRRKKLSADTYSPMRGITLVGKGA